MKRLRHTAAGVLMACSALISCATPPPSDVAPASRLRVAQAAENSGDHALARTMYATAAAEAWTDRTIQLRASEGLARVGAPADAMALLDATLRRTPRDHDIRRTLGALQIVNGLPAQAEQNLGIVVAARPEDDSARINLGVALDMLRRHPEAQAMYRTVLARMPGDADAANDLALSLILSGRSGEARGVLLPFRGRSDLPERMRTTMALADGTPGAALDPSLATLAPVQGAPVPLR